MTLYRQGRKGTQGQDVQRPWRPLASLASLAVMIQDSPGAVRLINHLVSTWPVRRLLGSNHEHSVDAGERRSLLQGLP